MIDSWARLRASMVLMALAGAPVASGAQVARTTTEENFRNEPNGALVAVVRPGAELRVVGRDDPWVEAVLEGWVWIRSLQVTDQPGFDLIVSEPEGENLREEPSGRVLARLGSQTLLEELERIPGWIRVRRRGWIWSESVEVETTEAPPVPPPTAAAAEGAAADPSPPEEEADQATLLAVGPGGGDVLRVPDGDTLAKAAPNSDVQVLERSGAWARVRIEGWMRVPAADTPAAGGVRVAQGPDDVARDPDRFRGAIVTWELQFISLERAEAIRSDFSEGEPFLLTRPLSGQGRFVYVAVPEERAGEFESLVPLERVTITARVRIGASRLTGSPVLELLELRRQRGAGGT